MDSTYITFEKRNINNDMLIFIRGFLFSTLSEIEKTYFGDSYYTTKNQMEHFIYCTEQVKKKYEKIGVMVNLNRNSYTPIFDFFFKAFYDFKKSKNSIENVKIKIHKMFSYELKIKSTMKETIALYNIFSQAL